MSASAVHVLLLLRARDAEHAQKAWQRMLWWTPSTNPRELDQQVNDALRLADCEEVDNKWESERIADKEARGAAKRMRGR